MSKVLEQCALSCIDMVSRSIGLFCQCRIPHRFFPPIHSPPPITPLHPPTFLRSTCFTLGQCSRGNPSHSVFPHISPLPFRSLHLVFIALHFEASRTLPSLVSDSTLLPHRPRPVLRPVVSLRVSPETPRSFDSLSHHNPHTPALAFPSLPSRQSRPAPLASRPSSVVL